MDAQCGHWTGLTARWQRLQGAPKGARRRCSRKWETVVTSVWRYAASGSWELPWNQVSLRGYHRASNTFRSVQFSCSLVSDSLRPHELQNARPPCPSPTPRVHPNPCPLSQWCHPTISFSVVPFSSLLQSFPASGSFQTSQLFASRAKVLEFQLQHQSFQWILRTDLL